VNTTTAVEDAIRVRGAHTHNLRNLDVDIPHGRWVTFTGVSGSGKSSLVFDTVHTEAQRQLIETFSTFARQRLPQLSRPDVERIENLTTSIVIDQKPLGRSMRSTVGTATELHTYLRLLYARCGDTPGIPSFYLGFNNPAGMCPRCEGLGRIIEIDTDLLLDRSRSIRDGAITHPDWKTGSWQWRELVALDRIDVDVAVRDLPADQVEWLLHSPPVPVESRHGAGTYRKTWRGIAAKLAETNADRDSSADGDGRGTVYQRYLVPRTCPTCAGLRLNERALAVRLDGVGIGDVLTMELQEVDTWLAGIEYPVAVPMVHKMRQVLGHLITIGVGYLTLNRPVSTLSGGESQRVKLARQLDCDLSRMTYVLDEPSIGLHPRDTRRLIEMIRGLRDRGNTVLVVEHDPDVIGAADHVIEIGPGPGRHGGRLVFTGPAADFRTSDTPVATAVRALDHLPRRVPRPWSTAWEIRGASANNLRGVDVDIPQGVLVAVTGVAGSGKSSLVHEVFLADHPEAVVVDQSSGGRWPPPASRAPPAPPGQHARSVPGGRSHRWAAAGPPARTAGLACRRRSRRDQQPGQHPEQGGLATPFSPTIASRDRDETVTDTRLRTCRAPRTTLTCSARRCARPPGRDRRVSLEGTPGTDWMGQGVEIVLREGVRRVQGRRCVCGDEGHGVLRSSGWSRPGSIPAHLSAGGTGRRAPRQASGRGPPP
jgi:excinuclease UvrABC ATPase subunit